MGTRVEPRIEAGEQEPRRAPGDIAGERRPWWLYPNLLGLDAPVVAVAWQSLFARAFAVHMPWTVSLVLGLSVWLIYTGDRLLDARRLTRERILAGGTARHEFVRRNWKSLLVLWCMALLAAAGTAGAFLPVALAVRGMFFAGLVLLYFLYAAWLRRRMRVPLPKEVLCGFLFAIGTGLGVTFFDSTAQMEARRLYSVLGFFAEGAAGIMETLRPPVVLFGLLCTLNCIAIAVWEREADRLGDRGAVTHARADPGASIGRGALLLIAVAGMLAVLEETTGPSLATLFCLALSALGLWLLHRNEDRFSRSALRVLADVALLTPLAPLLLLP